MKQERQGEIWVLVLESVLLFIGMPLLMFWELIPVPKILMLILVAGYCGYQLWQDSEFGRGILTRKSTEDASKNVLIRTPFVIVGLFGLVWFLHPERLFAFPAERTGMWLVVIIIYPLFSALPQEFIYRTFFFHRYRKLLSSESMIVFTSAALFSFMHIVYHNWWAIGISFIGGLLFGITYTRTKSLFWIVIEHTIYGWLVFTLGLGRYFYEAL